MEPLCRIGRIAETDSNLHRRPTLTAAVEPLLKARKAVEHGHYRLLQQIGKTKISPTPREFLGHTDFLHTLIRSRPPVGPSRGAVVPLRPRGPSTLVPSLSATSAHCNRRNSLRRNARTENAARKSADNIGTHASSEGAWPWGISFPSRHD
jgi:hypothetical protein